MTYRFRVIDWASSCYYIDDDTLSERCDGQAHYSLWWFLLLSSRILPFHFHTRHVFKKQLIIDFLFADNVPLSKALPFLASRHHYFLFDIMLQGRTAAYRRCQAIELFLYIYLIDFDGCQRLLLYFRFWWHFFWYYFLIEKLALIFGHCLIIYWLGLLSFTLHILYCALLSYQVRNFSLPLSAMPKCFSVLLPLYFR